MPLHGLLIEENVCGREKTEIKEDDHGSFCSKEEEEEEDSNRLDLCGNLVCNSHECLLCSTMLDYKCSDTLVHA